MASRSLRILCRIDWVDEAATVSRLWDGAGPFVDTDGEIWVGCAALTGLEAIEMAINGEAYTLSLTLSGVSSAHADLAWESFTSAEIVGSTVRLLVQKCDPVTDQPIGAPEVRFTGTIDNPVFAKKATADGVLDSITVEVTNRFTMRRRSRGAVLSDADQRARSAILNPGANADRFCERVPLMQDKTVSWPRWN